jgi:hypothetical protein
VSLGYGDLFVAALLGAVLANDRRRQWSTAVLTLVLAGLFDLLFLVLHELPATVPVALALIVEEAWTRWGASRVRIPRRRRRETEGAAAGAPASS